MKAHQIRDLLPRVPTVVLHLSLPIVALRPSLQRVKFRTARVHQVRARLPRAPTVVLHPSLPTAALRPSLPTEVRSKVRPAEELFLHLHLPRRPRSPLSGLRPLEDSLHLKTSLLVVALLLHLPSKVARPTSSSPQVKTFLQVRTSPRASNSLRISNLPADSLLANNLLSTSPFPDRRPRLKLLPTVKVNNPVGKLVEFRHLDHRPPRSKVRLRRKTSQFLRLLANSNPRPPTLVRFRRKTSLLPTNPFLDSNLRPPCKRRPTAKVSNPDAKLEDNRPLEEFSLHLKVNNPDAKLEVSRPLVEFSLLLPVYKLLQFNPVSNPLRSREPPLRLSRLLKSPRQRPQAADSLQLEESTDRFPRVRQARLPPRLVSRLSPATRTSTLNPFRAAALHSLLSRALDL